MRWFTTKILASLLTLIIVSTAFAGNIAGGKVAGNIPGGRTAGHIAVGRSSTPVTGTGILLTDSSRIDLESAISEGFAGLIRMLLVSGALL